VQLGFSLNIFENIIKCYEYPSSVSRTVPRGQSDKQDEANSRF